MALDYDRGIRLLVGDPEVGGTLDMLEAELYYATVWANPAEVADPARAEALAGLDLYLQFLKKHAGYVVDNAGQEEWFQ